ncbi:MAG: hypothetical protein IPJ09_13060 [Saprospiraceae bacterium]|nr:hypothetical protein [Saprospiraceae bacterium]
MSTPAYQQGVVFKPTGSGTNVTMEYKSSGLDQAPGKKQYKVFHFVQS